MKRTTFTIDVTNYMTKKEVESYRKRAKKAGFKPAEYARYIFINAVKAA